MAMSHKSVTHDPVCIEGNPNQVDSFVACLVAVLHVWDLKLGYDWVAGLAGLAFSPILDPGEDCTAWWMEDGSDARLGFLGRALGFTVDRVRRDATWDDEARATYAETGMFPGPHEAHFARLRAAFDRGDMVMLRTWPAWSVLTDWAPDVNALAFATVPGFKDLVAQIWGPAKAQLAYVLSLSVPVLTPGQAVEKALRFGACVAHGRGPEEHLGYGAALYRAAAEQMGASVFCTSCGASGDSCAHRTLMRMLGTQRSAVGFLADARDFFAEWDDLPWNQAIDAFAAMVDVTAPYCSWESFHAQWSDGAFRAQLRETFRHLVDQQDAAADALAALVSGFSQRVRESDGLGQDENSEGVC